MKEIAISGLVAGFVTFLLSSVFYIIPIISQISSQYLWECYKPYDALGGITNLYLFELSKNLVLTFFMAILYSYTEGGIVMKSAWKKGLFFGFLIFLVVEIPFAYFKWITSNYPGMLNILDILGGVINTFVGGIIIAVLYARLSSLKS